MEVLQRFTMKLDRFEGSVIIAINRTPNQNGFIRSAKYQVPACWAGDHVSEGSLRSIDLNGAEKQIVLDEAAKLWDEYWTVHKKGAATSWRKWSKGDKS